MTAAQVPTSPDLYERALLQSNAARERLTAARAELEAAELEQEQAEANLIMHERRPGLPRWHDEFPAALALCGFCGQDQPHRNWCPRYINRDIPTLAAE